jgi:hypothetical protein
VECLKPPSGSPTSGAPLREMRAFSAEGAVLPVPGVEPSVVRKRADPRFKVVGKPVKALRGPVRPRVCRALGDHALWLNRGLEYEDPSQSTGGARRLDQLTALAVRAGLLRPVRSSSSCPGRWRPPCCVLSRPELTSGHSSVTTHQTWPRGEYRAGVDVLHQGHRGHTRPMAQKQYFDPPRSVEVGHNGRWWPEFK